MTPQKCSECTKYIPDERMKHYKNRPLFTCSKICSGVRDKRRRLVGWRSEK